ncbi:MAG: hypothetical protein ACYS4W_04985 [Planctomycetota bacterium]|jgi:hypothetical protein
MKAIKKGTICLIVAAVVGVAPAAVRYVPQDYEKIQDAVDASENGDTVVLAPYTTYSGVRNYNVDFKGMSITIRGSDPTNPEVVSSTVVDCQGRGRAFVFRTGEGRTSVLAGLTITDGYGLVGGGIYCYNNSSPLIIQLRNQRKLCICPRRRVVLQWW